MSQMSNEQETWPVFDGNMKPPLWQRREQIATAVLAGLVVRQPSYYNYAVADAVAYADALIAELDKPKEDKT